MSKVTFIICDVCGQKIDRGEEYRSLTIVPHGGKAAQRRAKQRTCQVCLNCFERIGFQAELVSTIAGGRIGRVEK